MEKKVKFSPLINFLICNLQVMSCTVVEEESFDEFEAIEVELGIKNKWKNQETRDTFIRVRILSNKYAS